MSRETPRGLGPPLPQGDATDPSTLAETTDPDGAPIDAGLASAGDDHDSLGAFEQRRKIYPQAAAASSSDGSVAAAYHAVHEVPRAHHDTLLNGVSSSPVVVDVGDAAPPDEPSPSPSAPPGRTAKPPREVATFRLPRSHVRRPVLVAALATVAALAGLSLLLITRSPSALLPAAAGELPAALPAASGPIPLAATLPVFPTPSASSSVAAAPAATGTTSAVRPAPVGAPSSSSPPRSRPPASPPSSTASVTPATARPAGDFDDLVRETKP